MIALEAFVMTAPAYFEMQDACNGQSHGLKFVVAVDSSSKFSKGPKKVAEELKTICELIEKSFSARTVGEKKDILQHKKPTTGMRRKNGFVAQLIYKECFAGRAFCWLLENRKRGQEKDMPICVVFFPIAESMSDRTAIWRPMRSGRHLTRQKGSIFYSQELDEKRCSAIMSR